MSNFATVPAHVPAALVRGESWWIEHDATGDPNALFDTVSRGSPIAYIVPCARFPCCTWVLFSKRDVQLALTDTAHFTSHRVSGYDDYRGA